MMVAAQERATELLERATRLLEERDLRAAWEGFVAAESDGADVDSCSAGRWQAAMLRGDFDAAWKESDAIRRRGSQGADCLWSGEAIDGKRVIVRCLHGFGDAVQMMRYAPAVAARAASVTYEAAPKLLPLLRCFPGVEDAITWSDADPAWDVQVEVMELPYLLRTSMDELPIEERYLAVPEEALRAAGEQLGRRARPRIGLVWTCGEWNPSREMPAKWLEEFASVDAEFWSLESKSPVECCGLELRDGRQITNGLVPLAAVIANLDLVITPDTLAAHLAGALGVRACVMLQFAADWRWMTERVDSPWYPSLRLYRQPAHGDWRSVVRAVRADVERWIS